MQIFALNAAQLRDVANLVSSLNDYESDLRLDDEDDKVGKGYRAAVKDPIPVYSDDHGTKELLGWVKWDEFNYAFTQKDPYNNTLTADKIRSEAI